MAKPQTIPLRELIEVDRGISYGIVQPGSHVACGIPIVRVGDVKNGRIQISEPLCVSEAIEAKHSRTRLRGGELIITIVGSVGQTAIVPESLAGWNVARAIAVLPIRAEIGAYWVQLALRAPSVRERIDSRLNTTVQATLNLGDIAELPILVPPMLDRERIASILAALDDKIELNRRMNETLEAMARTLFKDWFVDFGPTRAKQQGLEPYLATELWSLFPERLDAEGKPEGWKEGMLSDITDIQNGYAFKSSDWQEEGVPVVKIGSVKPAVVDLENVSFVSKAIGLERSAFRLASGNILVGLTGYVGEVGRVPPTDNLPLLNQRVGRFRPKSVNNGFSSIVYSCVRQPEFKEFAKGKAHGSAQPNVSTRDLLSFPLTLSGQEITDAFEKVCGPLFDRSLANLAENRILSQTRDLLLPKLMSGEIRIKDTEQVAEAAL